MNDTSELVRVLMVIGFAAGALLGVVLAATALIRWIFRISEQIQYLKSIDARLARLAPLPEARPSDAPAAASEPAKA